MKLLLCVLEYFSLRVLLYDCVCWLYVAYVFTYCVYGLCCAGLLGWCGCYCVYVFNVLIVISVCNAV